MFTVRQDMISLLDHVRKLSSEVTSPIFFVLKVIHTIWFPIFQRIYEQRKGKAQMESVFSPKIPA